VDRGHITTYQFSMVTNNINLFKASKVVNEGQRLTVYYPGDARFQIKYFRVNHLEQLALIELVTPRMGARPSLEPTAIFPVPEKPFGILEGSRVKYAVAIYNAVAGFIFIGVGLYFIYNGAIHFPGSPIFISVDSSPYQFYMFSIFALVSGVSAARNGLHDIMQARENK